MLNSCKSKICIKKVSRETFSLLIKLFPANKRKYELNLPKNLYNERDKFLSLDNAKIIESHYYLGIQVRKKSNSTIICHVRH